MQRGFHSPLAGKRFCLWKEKLARSRLLLKRPAQPLRRFWVEATVPLGTVTRHYGMSWNAPIISQEQLAAA